jgi:hypothetical protein
MNDYRTHVTHHGNHEFKNGLTIKGVSLDALREEAAKLDGATAGTVAANKVVIADANKDISAFRNLGAQNIDAGASGTAGSVDVFPSTASKGKLAITCENQTGDTTVALKAEAMGQATVIGIPDPGAADADLLHSKGGQSIAAANTITAGAAAAAVALRLGATATEGLEIKVIDETVTLTNAVETDLTETVPAGAVILSVQANLATAVTGDASGDDGLTKVGIGVTADPDKYGLSADLAKNTKINTIPDWAVLAGAETVTVKAADNAGAAVTEKFTAGGEVRVRLVYAVLNSLDDVA